MLRVNQSCNKFRFKIQQFPFKGTTYFADGMTLNCARSMSLLFFTLIASFSNEKAVFIIGVLLKLEIRKEKWDSYSLIG